ncbi:hypothetical protein [Endozoicomonas sp. 2B-B]
MKTYLKCILAIITMVNTLYTPKSSAIEVFKKEGRLLVLRDVPISHVLTPRVMMAAIAYNLPVTLSGAVLGSFFGGLGACFLQDANVLNSLPSDSFGIHATDYGISIVATSSEMSAALSTLDSGISIGWTLGATFGAAFGAFSIGFIFSNMIQRYGLDEAISRFTQPWAQNRNTEFD